MIQILKKRVMTEDAWSGVVSLMELPPQIFAVRFLQGTIYTLSKDGPSFLMSIHSFISPLWNQAVQSVKTSVVLYGPCFLISNLR